MNSFFAGMIYLLRGIGYLPKKGLKRFIILPLMFNFVLFLGLFYLIYHFMFPYSQYLVDQLPGWLNFLRFIFLILMIISFFLFFLSMFTVFFNLLAAPFNGFLAEKTQLLLFHSAIPALSFAQIAKRSIKRQIQFLFYFLPRFVGVCLLFFVPFIHTIYPLIWFLFNAWILSVQYQDFTMDNNLVSFNHMLDKMNQQRMLSLGFGSLINLASFTPVLNLFIMPAAVIAGVLIYNEEQRSLIKTSL